MRKLILSALLVAATSSLFAQKLDDIQDKIGKKKYGEAKEKVDAALNDPKNQSNADYWFAKAQVYNNLAQEKQDTTLQAEALTAIQKYFQLESGKEESKRALKSALEGHKTAFDIYSNYFKSGVNAFQAQNWPLAYNNFTKTLDAFDVISKNKLTNVSFDTTAVLYAGYSAQNAKLTDQAAKYYAQLADIKIADTSYMGIYEYLVGYYQEKKDPVNTQKYIDLGKSLFPNNPNWMAYELQGLEGDKAKKMAKLEEMIKQNPQNTDLQMEYAVDLFNYTYGKDKPADYEKRQADLTTALKKSIELSPTNAYANYILTQHLSNQIYDLQQTRTAIKGTKPEDAKKKQDLNKQIDGLIEEQFKYASAAYDLYDKMGASIKPGEKASFRAVTNLLIDYYTMKKQMDKVKVYETKLDTIK
ncbi:hypothetical protein [Flavisolibacter tropicus]|uniref:Tetratricopeptide repeat protein n=1 Tax=Flavisolibacter tropicus TaxID=1492898 RepID=A0A172TRG1_9BACT|nr:hypothetical protein [Flavisolibacter tropicus]ANE49586.1 hypothetical protein SY85_02775 [Flavisolibacter tropicus]